MVRKSRITLSKPKTAASRKETHERVNEQTEKATSNERREDRYSTQGEFPSSSCLIRNAGKERARRRDAYIYTRAISRMLHTRPYTRRGGAH